MIKLNKNQPAPQAKAAQEQPKQQQSAPKQQQPMSASAGKGLGFLHKGESARTKFEQEEKRRELASKGKVFRYWLPKESDGQITFLDGGMSNGMLDATFYYEHQVNMNGSWNNHFICTQESEPCPICEGGSNPSYVAVFTVIDHSEYTSKKDQQLHKDVVKLFVAKADTYKLLQKKALKQNGLRGVTFDVSRTGDKSPSVGSSFDFVEKLSEAELLSKFGKPAKQGEPPRHIPYNYETILGDLYMTAKDLRKLGFGSLGAPIGSEPPADQSFEDQV